MPTATDDGMQQTLAGADGSPGARVFRAAVLAAVVFVGVFWVEGVALSLSGGGLRISPRRMVLMATVGAILAVPVLLCGVVVAAAARLFRRRLTGGALAGILGGLVLLVVPFAVGVLLVKDSDDPDTLRGFVELWLRNPSALLYGLVPYVASSGVFGWRIHRGSNETGEEML